MSKQHFSKLSKKILATALNVALLAGLLPVLMQPQVAFAQDTMAPGIFHWSVSKIAASSAASTTVELLVFSSDNVSTPGGGGLTVTAYYKNPGFTGWPGWAATTCDAVYGNSNLHKCKVGITASTTDARAFQYYIQAQDAATNNGCISFATTTSCAPWSAQTYPFQGTVYNYPVWSNTITTVSNESGVKDGRCFSLTRAATSTTNILYVDANVAADLGRATSTWTLLGPGSAQAKKFKVLATSTVGTEMVLTLSGYTAYDYALSTCVEKFIPGATVWLEGVGATSTPTTTDYDTAAYNQPSTATTTFGTFRLNNVPDGTWEVVAFKNGYGSMRQGGITVSGGATVTPPGFPLPYGFQGGQGGDMQGAKVIWSAPMDGTMSTPTEIAPGKMPILVALSENASSTSITTSTVLLKKVNPDSSTQDVSGYNVAYEPRNETVTIGSQTYDFGPDAKIIVYSAANLASSTSYIVRITSSVLDANNNPISGNDPAGGHTVSFSTGSFFSGGIGSGDFGQGGAFMPPFVLGNAPTPGTLNVPTNTKILVKFNQPMDSASISQNVKLYRVSPAPGDYISANVALDRASSEIAVLSPQAALTAGGQYSIRVLGGARSASGVSLARPGEETNTMFQADFTVGTAADNIPPTIISTSLERYRNAAGNLVDVPVSTAFKFAFSEPMDPDTLNTNNVYLRVKGSTQDITGTAEYDLMEGKVMFLPGSALNATTTYVFTLTGNVKDLTTASNALATTTLEFITGGPDVQSPRLEFFNADDYRLSLTLSEPMNAAGVSNTTVWSSGQTKWQTSVLNPKNYVVYVDNGPSGSTAKYFGCDNLAGTTTGCATAGTNNLTFTYDAFFNTVEIRGLQLFNDPSGIRGGVRVWVNNVTDTSGNVISDSNAKTPPGEFGNNSKGGPVQDSMQTFGMIGPGGGMFGPPPSAGGFAVTDFGGKDPAMMGMRPVGVFPMNMLAGATSIYMIDIPVSSTMAIPLGGKIVLGPFPSESNISGAIDADPNKKYAHFDLNGPGPGQPQIASVVVSSQVITITLGNASTGAPDFIHLELDGIKNPTTPTLGGYKINIQTQDASGRQLESFASMPFFIMPKGKFNLVGQVKTSWGTGLNAVKLFGGSPSTGPLFTTSATNTYGGGQAGEYKIEGLNVGGVMLMPEPVITPSGTTTEFISPMPQPVFVDDSVTANTVGGVPPCTSQSTCYLRKDFSLTAISAANTPALTVEIIGNFSAGAIGTTDVDIFGGGPNGFRVKTVTLNQNYTTAIPYSATFNLPSTGDYMVGVGPAMPKGPMGMGGASMPDKWMPPKPENVTVSGSGGTWTWAENSDTANDGKLRFTIQTADKTIPGHVRDPLGNAVSNAEVFAYSPTEMFGTGSHVKQDGSFTLNVKAGSYKVGAFLPGAPPSGEISVEVKTTDPLGTVRVEGVATTDVILKLSKNVQQGYTISGYVYSTSTANTQYPASDASVYAYRTDGPGHMETMTESKGSYTLYVVPGTWKVGAYLPSHGKLTEQTVIITTASKSGINFAPSAAVNYVTLRERVWEDKDNDGSYDPGEGVARAAVSIISTTTDFINTAITDENGVYELKMPGSTVYDLKVWSPELGNLPPQKNLAVTTSDIIYATSSDISTKSGFADVPLEHATTVEIVFYDSAGNATTVDKVLVQLDKTGAAGISNDVYKENVATTTLKVSTSTEPYILDIDVRGIPKELLTITPVSAAATALGTTTVGTFLFATTTVNGYEQIKAILPAVSYISGQVTDGTNAVPYAVIHVEQPGKDIEFDVETDANGRYSFRAASSSVPYLIQADRAGYIDTAVSVYASTSAVTFNPVMATTSYTISGTLTLNNAAPGTECYVYAEKLGGGYVSTSGNCNPATGAYTINVNDGNWEVSAVVEGYSQATQSTITQVATGNVAGVNLNVAATKTLESQETLGMSGNVGGSLVNQDAGFEMQVPRSTLSASDSSSYNVKEKEISNVPAFTPTANLVGDKAEEISAYKMSGANGNVSTVSTLNGAAFIDKVFTKTELAAEGIDSVAEIEQTKMASYDETAQNWTNIPTTITYLNASDQPVIPQTGLGNVEKVVFNGAIKHFSKIGVVNTAYDGLAPAVPANITVTSEVGRVKISWSAVTTNIDGTAANDIIRYNIYRSTSPSDVGSWTKIGSVPVGTTTYYDPASSGTTYYYRVTADTGLQSGFSGVSSGGQAQGAVAGGSIAYSPSAPAAEEPKKIVLEETKAPEAVAKPVVEEKIPTVILEKPVSQMTATEIEAKIAEIIQVINTLKEMLKEAQAKEAAAAAAGIPADYKFEQRLEYGQTSDDVKYLQEFLKSQGSDIYPEGIVSGYFGPLTKAAVSRFQEKYTPDILAPWGLTEGTGLVGKTTREKINALLGR